MKPYMLEYSCISKVLTVGRVSRKSVKSCMLEYSCISKGLTVGRNLVFLMVGLMLSIWSLSQQCIARSQWIIKSNELLSCMLSFCS